MNEPRARSPARIRAGISGWRYVPWRGTFYPPRLPQRCELEYAAKILPVIEINGTFYALQKPASYAQWYAETPDDFVFAVKAPRYITHVRRLRDVHKPLANFFASGLLRLREKLGPILWQLPPNFRYDPVVLRQFLDVLPRDTRGAAALGRRRDAFMKGRSSFAVDVNRPLRHAMEVRHASFADPGFVALLRDRNVALVFAESSKPWPVIEDVTADFIYLRLHGDKEIYRSGYGDKALTRWARRIAAWHRGTEPADAARVVRRRAVSNAPRDVFCFFDNTDVKLRAPFDAQTLSKKLGLERRDAP